MKIYLTLFLCSIFLLGCGGGTPYVNPPMPENSPVRPSSSGLQSQASCQAKGGKWMVMHPNNGMGCNVNYADGGKRCTDNSQCQSQACQSANKIFFEAQNNPNKRYTGQCASSTHNKLNSCLERLVNGRPVLQGCN